MPNLTMGGQGHGQGHGDMTGSNMFAYPTAKPIIVVVFTFSLCLVLFLMVLSAAQSVAIVPWHFYKWVDELAQSLVF